MPRPRRMLFVNFNSIGSVVLEQVEKETCFFLTVPSRTKSGQRNRQTKIIFKKVARDKPHIKTNIVCKFQLNRLSSFLA